MAWREEWLNESRVSAYSKILIVFYLAFGIAWIALSKDLVDLRGKPVGYDFITFWAASDLALEGRAVDAYDPVKILAVQQKAVPANTSVYLWHYPPVFHLVVLPLALLPYLLSCALFIAFTLALYVAYMRRVFPGGHTLLLLLAFPAAFVNVIHGQNGFLTAVLVAAACLNLERRPVLAGVLIGALCYKPHFGLLFPLVLIAGRHWVSFAAAALTTAILCAAATVVFGFESWVAFWQNLALTREVLEAGFLPWAKMPTVFAAIRMLGGSVTLAYVLQFAAAAAVTVMTVYAWYRGRGSFELRVALLTVALLLISPYGFDYDLVILALPIGLLAVDGMRNGWMPGVRTILVVVWFMPLVMPGIAERISLQFMPVVLLLLFALVWRRLGTRVHATAPLKEIARAA